MQKTFKKRVLTPVVLLFAFLGTPFAANSQEYSEEQVGLAGVYGVQLEYGSGGDLNDDAPSRGAFPQREDYLNTLSELHSYAAGLFKSPTSSCRWLETLSKELRGGSALDFVRQELEKQNDFDGYMQLVYLKEDLETSNNREFTIAQIEIFFAYYLTAFDEDDKIAVLRAFDVIVKGAIKDAVESTDADYLPNLIKDVQNGKQKDVALKLVPRLRKALNKRLQTASEVLKEQKANKTSKNTFWINHFVKDVNPQPDFKNGPDSIVTPGMKIIGEYVPFITTQAFPAVYLQTLTKRDILLGQGTKLKDIDLDKLASDSFDEFFGKPAEQLKKNESSEVIDLEAVFDEDESSKHN